MKKHFYSRLEEIKFTRLRLGHTRLTHSYLFTENQPPMCTECECECPRYRGEYSSKSAPKYGRDQGAHILK